jgi:hypothetical protein
MTNGVETIVMVMRTLLALCAGFVVLVGVATVARPEPGPCRDTVSIPFDAAPSCAAPTADTRLVLTSAAAASVVTWLGSGILQKRLVRP